MATPHNQIQDLIEKRDKAIRNMKRQKLSSILARHTRRDIRVRPEYWEQVARDYSREIARLKKIELNNSEL